MTWQGPLTKTTPVSALLQRLRRLPLTVEGNASLAEIGQRSLGEPHSGMILVLDASQRLVGIIPVTLLVEDIVAHIAPEDFLTEIMEPEEATEFYRLREARLARDLMQEPVWIKPVETVGTALKRLHEHRLPGLPIVDDELRPLGYLDLLELLSLWLEGRKEL